MTSREKSFRGLENEASLGQDIFESGPVLRILCFQGKLKNYSRNKEEIMNCADGQQLLIKGVNKIQLEYDAARRAGPKMVVLPPIEFFSEQIIEKKYDARVVPIIPNND